MIKQIKNLVTAHTLWLETDGKEGEQANFEKMNLQEIDLKDLNLSNSIFRNTNLTRANIENCQFDGSDFTNTDLSYSNCTNTNFKHCNLTNTNFDGSTIINSDFSSSKLHKTNFYNTQTRYLNFDFIKSTGSIFRNAILLGATFKKSILDTAYFDNANISKVIFEETELINSYLDTAIGIPSKNDIIETELDDDKYIARKSQIKLLRRLGKIFYSLATLLTSIIIFIGLFELYNIFMTKTNLSILNFNYFSWISLDIVLVILATSLNMLMNWIIRDDKIHLEELNHG